MESRETESDSSSMLPESAENIPAIARNNVDLPLPFFPTIPMNEEELREGGITPSTVRLSIGTENIDDIIADLEHGFEAIK